MSAEVVVLGSGVDGLICATLLARAGRRVTVLERRSVVGGRAVTESFHEGFRVSPLLHGWGGLHPRVARELGLAGRLPLAEDRGVTTLRAGRACTSEPPARRTRMG